MYRFLNSIVLFSLILCSISIAQAQRVSPITWDEGTSLLTSCTNSPDAKTSEPMGLVTKCCSVSLGYCVTCPSSTTANDDAKICRKGTYLISGPHDLNVNNGSNSTVVKPLPQKSVPNERPKKMIQ